jgi:DNA-directed RNA polymerase sigma subunit (sigma70/sigma32)
VGDDAVYTDDDPLDVYLSQLQQIPPLGRAEEIDCIEHVLAGDQMAETAGRRLIQANLLLVVSIAERYRNDQFHLLDLIQKGNDGLMLAVDNLRDSKPDQFLAHATNHIERAIAEAIASSGPTTS